jgi:hypothetical protein
MTGLRAALLLTAGVLVAGCTKHVLFAEHSHLGLKASFEPNQPTPAEVDLGWRRALFAMVPQKSEEKSQASSDGSVKVSMGADGRRAIEVTPDPNELMSIYAVFRANVGFRDPICVHHFLATGVAASMLLANENDLRVLSRSLEGSDEGSPCATTATDQDTEGVDRGDTDADTEDEE